MFPKKDFYVGVLFETTEFVYGSVERVVIHKEAHKIYIYTGLPHDNNLMLKDRDKYAYSGAILNGTPLTSVHNHLYATPALKTHIKPFSFFLHTIFFIENVFFISRRFTLITRFII